MFLFLISNIFRESVTVPEAGARSRPSCGTAFKKKKLSSLGSADTSSIYDADSPPLLLTARLITVASWGGRVVHRAARISLDSVDSTLARRRDGK